MNDAQNSKEQIHPVAPTIDGGGPSPKKLPEGREIRVFRTIMNILVVVVLALLGVLIWSRVISQNRQAVQQPDVEVTTKHAEVAIQDSPVTGNLPPFDSLTISRVSDGIPRVTDFRTTIPNRPRQEVITYTVKRNDTLFGIADSFGVKPETILWGNFETLQDNPHFLKPDQVLNILPVDGTYYEWKNGDNLAAVAGFFGVDPEAIIEFTGNQIDLTALDSQNAGLQADSWIVVPGGKRAIKDWGPPAITRQNPASASYYGEGSCGSIYEGAVGTGTFTWPTVSQSVSGYNYSGIHPAVDFAGATGNAVFASDSGVVVYAGWSNYGYGYLIVIDHGNGYQTAYAHLSAVAVTCGQSVFQTGYIGAVGNTGNSTGSHLHFELSYGGAKLNPLEYLP